MMFTDYQKPSKIPPIGYVFKFTHRIIKSIDKLKEPTHVAE